MLDSDTEENVMLFYLLSTIVTKWLNDKDYLATTVLWHIILCTWISENQLKIEIYPQSL